MTIIRCRACSAWEPFEEDGRAKDFDDAMGYCRRFAPRPALSGSIHGGPGEVVAEWPHTSNASGCAEGIA